MPLYEVLGKGHRVNDGTEMGRLAEAGEIVELPAEAAAPFIPWRLRPVEDQPPEKRKRPRKEESADGDAQQ